MGDDEKLTREQLRSCRKHPVRARVFAVGRSSLKERRRLAILYPEAQEPYWRPVTRADCAKVERPCPYVGCRYNLYLDVQSSGAIKVNFPDIEPEEMKTSCVLDVTDKGPVTLEETGEIINVTRERVRQIEKRATLKVEREDPELATLIGAWAYPSR
jgi:hypothetical protein